MSTYLLNTKKEFSKLLYRKKYIVFLIIGVAIVALRFGAGALITRFTGGSVVLKSNIALELLRLVAEFFVPIIAFMGAADLFSTQQREDTLKADFMRPVTRFKLLLSKTTAIMIMCAIYFMAFFLVCAVVQGISGAGFKHMPHAFLAYLLDLVPLVNIVLLAVLVNLISPSPSMAMLLSLVAYALLKYCSYFVGNVSQLLFTSYSLWHNLWIGSGLPFGAIAWKLGVIFGSMLILFSVSCIMFDRKEV